jgi:hypothetical protein
MSYATWEHTTDLKSVVEAVLPSLLVKYPLLQSFLKGVESATHGIQQTTSRIWRPKCFNLFKVGGV